MKLIIDENQADQRLDRYLRKFFKDQPHIKLSMIFSWLRTGVIKVNWKKQKENYRLHIGDEITINQERAEEVSGIRSISSAPSVQQKHLTIEDIKPLIIYEDSQWLVFNKPSGVIMHGRNDGKNIVTMHDFLSTYVQLTGIETNETFSPSFCYRLDKDTSGVLIAAKTYESLQYLNKLIRDREVDKNYLTVVAGDTPEHFVMDQPLEKVFDKGFNRGKTVVSENGVEAYSEATKIKTIDHELLGEISLLRVKIRTGRMHQIRVHLADARFPVLGDLIYGVPSINRVMYKKLKINRQVLHCEQYSFWDSIQKKEQIFTIEHDRDIDKLMGT